MTEPSTKPIDNNKIAKLQQATLAAKADLDQKEREWKDSKERLDVAKELLTQALTPEEQASMKINDTKYPALLALHQVAQDAYETAQKRYETNQKYLDMYTGKETTRTTDISG